MITWVSERSGTASSGVRNSAAIPNPTAIRTPATVKTQFRAQASIRRAIMAASPLLRRRAQLALRGDQEVARAHHDLARPQTAPDLVIAAGAHSELHLARGESPVPEVDEHHRALPGG